MVPSITDVCIYVVESVPVFILSFSGNFAAAIAQEK